MIRCDQAEQLISLQMDCQLHEKEEKHLEAHIANCESCAQKRMQYREISERLKNVPQPDLPETFHADVMTALGAQPRIAMREKRNLISFRKIVTAAAGMACALFLLSAVSVGLHSVTRSARSGEGQTEASLRHGEAYDVSGNTVAETQGAASFAATDGAGIALAPAAEPDVEMQIASSEGVAFILDGTMAAGSDSTADEDTLSRKTYEIVLNVQSIDESVRAINSLGGYNTSTNVDYSSTSQSGYIVRRMGVSQYLAAIDILRKLGEVRYETESEEILTGQYRDTKAILIAKEEERERLFALLEKSRTMEVMVMVENRLSQVENEIDSYKSTLMNLEKSGREPELYIRLESDRAMQEEESPANFNKRVKNSFIGSLNATIQFMENVLILVSATFVPVLIVAAIIIPFFAVLRKRNAKEAGGDRDDEYKG